MAGDPYFSNVSLLLHMTGSNGSTTFTDSSKNAYSITTYGNAQISTAQSKWGGGSGLFDGSSDVLVGPNTSGFGAGDLTIELWVLLASYAQCSFWESSPLGSSGIRGTGFIWYLVSSGAMFFFSQGYNRLGTYSSAIPLNQWAHLALVRKINDWTIYVDGISVGTVNFSLDDMAGGQVIGGFCDGGPYAIDGYVNDFRVTKGVARYTSNFTVPDTVFPDYSDPAAIIIHSRSVNPFARTINRIHHQGL